MLAVVMFIPILLVFNGCAVLDYAADVSRQRQEEKLEILISKQEYHKALLLLDKIKPAASGEFYKSQRQEIIKLIDGFAGKTERNAMKQAEADDLLGAITLVKEALQKIPGNDKLLRLSSELNQERDQQLTANQLAVLANKAEYLYSRLQCYGDQAKLEKLSGREIRKKRNIKESLASLHPALVDCGRQAIELEDYEIAGRCLMIADKIDDSGSTSQLMTRLEERFSKEEKAAEKYDAANIGDNPLVCIVENKKIMPAEALSASFNELEKKLRSEIEGGKLVEAYRSLTKLEKFSNRNEEVSRYRKQLDKIREKSIAEKMERSSDLYRRGKIKEAREVWQQILLLDPENRIVKGKIARADVVLESIRDLQSGKKSSPMK